MILKLNRKMTNDAGVTLLSAVAQGDKELACEIIQHKMVNWSHGTVILTINMNWNEWQREVLLLPWQKVAFKG